MSPISVKGTFYASEGCHGFLSKVFCLIVPKKSVEEQFCAVFQKIPMSKGIMDKRGGGGWLWAIKISCRKIYVLQCRKNS